jgi:hypothetical protein
VWIVGRLAKEGGQKRVAGTLLYLGGESQLMLRKKEVRFRDLRVTGTGEGGVVLGEVSRSQRGRKWGPQRSHELDGRINVVGTD